MLSAVITAEAEKIAKATLRTAGFAKLTLLPKTAESAPTVKKPRVAKSGLGTGQGDGASDRAGRRKKLFDAEIQSVIDLSGKD